MNKKYLLLVLTTIALYSTSSAQVFIGGRLGGGYYRRPGHQRRVQRPQQDLPKFQPAVYVTVGYGFPNLDNQQLPVYYNYYNGTVSQKGPVTGSVDYRFNRSMSIGLMVTHGTVNMPYYDYNDPSTPVMRGSLNNWSYMLNFVRYMPASKNVTAYLRTAIGINSWVQDFTDASGNKINPPAVPSDLAYQVALGARFYLSKNAGLFVEAGYGKYILHGGVSFKF
ncbi:MAG: hypothetical protein ABI707_20875 [Ferruginibacter sp.]